MQIAGYSLIADDLTELLDKIYPDKPTLSQVLIQTLGQNIAQPIQKIIFEHADFGRRAFLDKFDWLNSLIILKMKLMIIVN